MSMLPVSIPATTVAGHAFSFGTPAVVEVRPDDVRVVDGSGTVMWESPRHSVRLSGAGMPGLRNAASAELVLRNARGPRRHLVFVDPKRAVYLTIAISVIMAFVIAALAVGLLDVELAAFIMPMLGLLSVVGRAGLSGGESTPGIRQALIDAIRADPG